MTPEEKKTLAAIVNEAFENAKKMNDPSPVKHIIWNMWDKLAETFDIKEEDIEE